MIRDCKYRLPCAWCDKYDRPCEAVQYELLKRQEEKPESKKCEHEWRYVGQNTNGHHYECSKCGIMKIVPLENLYSTNKECHHEWICDTKETTGGTNTYYYCRKCGAIKMIDSNNIIYESGEWQP